MTVFCTACVIVPSVSGTTRWTVCVTPPARRPAVVEALPTVVETPARALVPVDSDTGPPPAAPLVADVPAP